MKSPYISELQPNQVISGTFLVQHKDIRQKKTGEPCLTLVLGDRTGEIDARMWDNVAEVMETFDRDDFVRVRGLLQIYHNKPQLTVHKIQRQAPESLDVTDFYPASERNVAEMWNELMTAANSIGEPHLKQLVLALLQDSEVAAKFKLAPAAKNVHHAFLGGLLEHVVSMCGLARALAAHYQASHYTEVDVDLLLAGVILHDVGKVHELHYDRSFGYSSDGQLLGHIIIGLRMIGDKIASIPGFPPRLRSLLEHLILSHHGELEYGSPKLPLFPEALLLHQIDTIDSKMESMRSWLRKDHQVEGCWTGFNSALARPVLKKAKYLAGEPDVAPVPHAPETATAPSVAVNAATANGPIKPDSAPSRSSSSIFGEKLQTALRRPD